ncbi:MAG TPA: CotH kinase family protein [Pengzhenrongella sp.]
MTRRAGRTRQLITALVAALALAPAACGVVGGKGTDPQTEAVGHDPVQGSLFDSSVVHTLDVQVDEADVAAMISEYETSGEKTWIPGTVTIDGTELSDVGLRLKGNSSLSTLDADADPATLPWLVRLDKYVDGQSYRDITSFVVRSNITTTAVNEAVALELIELAGLASQQATSVRLTVNDGTARLRLVIENPDEDWASSVFDSPGLLYKSEARGDWSYRGDDPASYTDVFDQQAGEDDLTPLIELLDFVNNADDATFAAELADRVDVEAFARYLAVQELVGNFDTISGPGNNSYLWYDAETEVFTVVSWDQNLSFGITPMAGGMGGGPGVGGSLPDGMDPGNPPAMPEGFDPGDLPEGFDPDNPPEGFDPDNPPEGFDPGDLPAGGMGGMGSNILEERFRATPELAALYDEAVADLTAELIDSGAATEVLATWVTVLTEHAGDLVDTETIKQDAAAVAAYL